MSDSNRLQLSMVEESTFGVTPGTPTLLKFNKASSTLEANVDYTQSRTIREDRNVPDLVRVNNRAGGDIEAELQYDVTGAQWWTIKRSLQADAETAAASQATGITASTQVLTGTGVGTGKEVGDVVRVRTSGDVLVGYFRVVTVGSSSSITVEGGCPDGSNYKVDRGVRLKNGSTQKSATIEIAYLDVSKYEVLTGLVPDSFGVRIRDGEISTWAASFLGKTSSQRTAIAGSSYTPAPTTSVMDCKGNVPVLRVGATDYAAKSIDFRWVNNSAARTVIGTQGAVSIRSGSFVLTGSVEAYFSDFVEYEKFLASTDSAILVVTQDNAGNAFAWSLPRVKWSRVGQPTPGLDQDVMQRLSFQAVLHATEALSARVIAFAA